tara:strand:+ start:1816 stop:2496 length:681 start_codon:yes stop_codon:yes gene_type:complete
MSNIEYYVYHVTLGDRVVYVGKGQGDRYNHPLSGKSHNYRLNKYWFSHLLLADQAPHTTIIKYFQTEEAALSYEMSDITRLLPECNTIGKQKRYDQESCTTIHQHDTFIRLEDIILDGWERNRDKYPNLKRYIKSTFYQHKYRGSSFIAEVKRLSLKLTGEAIDVDVRVNNSRPSKFQTILSMTSAERSAYSRWLKKEGIEPKDLYPDNKKHMGMVSTWLRSRRDQ